MKKGMKSKGYAKGGAKMMKAKKGKMMKAMGGRMMAKGYSKGGAKKVMKASRGTATFMKNSGSKGQKAQNVADFTRATYLKALKNVGTGDRLTQKDVMEAARMLRKKK